MPGGVLNALTWVCMFHRTYQSSGMMISGVAEYLGLTTVRQMLYESGQRGVELLLDAIEKKPVNPVCEIMPAGLIDRQTTSTRNG
jgi:DNA-binding LacI/PurR family transcriptional regulator